MTENAPPLKLYVNDLNQIPFVCPGCGFSKLIALNSLSQRKILFKLKCRCGTPYRIQLEFRRFARKATKLVGNFSSGKKGESDLPVSVVNLSRGGACFEAASSLGIQVGTTGTLSFTLDDKYRTELKRQVIVKSCHGKKIGCEFIDKLEYEKALGFYLMS